MQGVLGTGELLVSMTFALIGWLKAMLEKFGRPCQWCRVAIRYVLVNVITTVIKIQTSCLASTSDNAGLLHILSISHKIWDMLSCLSQNHRTIKIKTTNYILKTVPLYSAFFHISN